MKTMIKHIPILLYCLVLPFGQSLAQSAVTTTANKGSITAITGVEANTQEEVRISRDRIIELQNESKASETKVNITDEYNFLSFKIAASLEQGNAQIEIFDPKGEKKGGFTVSSDGNHTGPKSSIKERVRGELAKSFRHPTKGDWIIRTKPSSAYGVIQIQTSQVYQENLDFNKATGKK
ncbi:MAG: hypothetical protein M0P69_10795 [Bacteroidales bacterium]|nr:hypothetical protein [Bacteroidales bacterium]